ncbi:C6 transcription factor [Lasiodiplodia theobromae]|uniref:C6 transcription factor n=1 Tax=Lasiodiplodia theobromae TaxID=45133 RepID=UPI0015C3ACBD|nr:C6 transcription factor [Lasiodiplodia theobromae]KAF4542907.1 C6 transcription factor [Lasiodiplodia theobromae]
MSATLRNPTEAMRLLSHTARMTNRQSLERPYYTTPSDKRPDDGDLYCHDMEYESEYRRRYRANEFPERLDDNPRGDDQTFSTWMHFRMCKDKVISPNEALFLINYFFEHMNPMRPIVSDYYHDPKNHLELLREEPTLACTIIATAARYTRLPGHGALTRGHLLHNSLLRHVQACTQRIIWGFGEEEMGIGRTIGFIESLLIFVCWGSANAGVHAHVIIRITRQSNRMVWMLIGLASTIAHEIGLWDADSIPSRITTENDERKLRVKKHLLLECVEAHFRLGKAATMQQPFGLSFELVHMATTALYQSPAQTKAMITSKKYLSAVMHYDTLLRSWHESASSIPSVLPALTAQAQIMYHAARSYIHLIGIQAIMERSLSFSYSNIQSDRSRVFDEQGMAEVMRLPETARDLELIKVIATGCRQGMENVIKLHEVDAFRNTTEQVRANVISIVICALKVASLNIEPKQDMILLLKKVVHIIEASAIDDLDLGPIYAESLRTLIAKVENARPVRAPAGGESTDQGEQQQHSHYSPILSPAQNSSSNDTTSTPSTGPTTGFTTGASSNNMTASASMVPITASSSSADGAAPSSFACGTGGGESSMAGDFGDPTAGMGTEMVGGAPADWSQWLAFQFDPSFSAFEMGHSFDATYPFLSSGMD